MNNIFYYDLETTSLDIENARILQIAILDGNGVYKLNKYVNPGNDVIITNSDIHSITREVLKMNSAKGFTDVFDEIYEYLSGIREDIYLIAHNNFRYDKRVLERECERNNRKIPNNWLFGDTIPLYKEFFPNKKRGYSLGVLYKDITEVDIVDAHNAMADVYALKLVFEKIWGKIKNYKNLKERCILGNEYEKKENIKIESIMGVGPATKLKLNKCNIFTVKDFVEYVDCNTYNNFKVDCKSKLNISYYGEFENIIRVMYSDLKYYIENYN